MSTFALLVNTFNHETHINDLLTSLDNCNVDVNLEVIFYDDCSTDDTYIILKEYQKRSDLLVKLVQPSENQYSLGEIPSLLAFRHTTADYLFLIEGDDFFISQDKINQAMLLCDLENSVRAFC